MRNLVAGDLKGDAKHNKTHIESMVGLRFTDIQGEIVVIRLFNSGPNSESGFKARTSNPEFSLNNKLAQIFC